MIWVGHDILSIYRIAVMDDVQVLRYLTVWQIIDYENVNQNIAKWNILLVAL